MLATFKPSSWECTHTTPTPVQPRQQQQEEQAYVQLPSDQVPG